MAAVLIIIGGLGLFASGLIVGAAGGLLLLFYGCQRIACGPR